MRCIGVDLGSIDLMVRLHKEAVATSELTFSSGASRRLWNLSKQLIEYRSSHLAIGLETNPKPLDNIYNVAIIIAAERESRELTMAVVANIRETRVNTTVDDRQEDPSIAYLADGGWIVTWTSNDRTVGGGQNIYQQRYSADGARVGVETRVNSTTANTQYQSSVAALEGGGWVVVWTSIEAGSNMDVFARCYDADGNEVTGEIRVNTPSTDARYTPSVTGLSGGDWLVTWTSNGQDGRWRGRLPEALYGSRGRGRYRATGQHHDVQQSRRPCHRASGRWWMDRRLGVLQSDR